MHIATTATKHARTSKPGLENFGLVYSTWFYKKQKIRACAEKNLHNGIAHFIILRFAQNNKR